MSDEDETFSKRADHKSGGHMLDKPILESDGIVVLKPEVAPSHQDFTEVRAAVDAYLGNHSMIHGVLISGWDGFKGLIDQIRFIRDYHTKIERVALVSDTYVPPGAEAVAQHFVGATIKHFSNAEQAMALSWLKSG
jgi:hypothetical protein